MTNQSNWANETIREMSSNLGDPMVTHTCESCLVAVFLSAVRKHELAHSLVCAYLQPSVSTQDQTLLSV